MNSTFEEKSKEVSLTIILKNLFYWRKFSLQNNSSDNLKGKPRKFSDGGVSGNSSMKNLDKVVASLCIRRDTFKTLSLVTLDEASLFR